MSAEYAWNIRENSSLINYYFKNVINMQKVERMLSRMTDAVRKAQSPISYAHCKVCDVYKNLSVMKTLVSANVIVGCN